MTRLISAKAMIRSASLVAAFAATLTSAAAQDVTLRGASMFDENHAFTKTMVRFAELVNEKYDGEVKFDLRLNGELGVEADYVTFLQQGAVTAAAQAGINAAFVDIYAITMFGSGAFTLITGVR